MLTVCLPGMCFLSKTAEEKLNYIINTCQAALARFKEFLWRAAHRSVIDPHCMAALKIDRADSRILRAISRGRVCKAESSIGQ